MKYKIVKEITGRALTAAGACEEELLKFVALYGFNNPVSAEEFEKMPLLWQGWLYENGFLATATQLVKLFSESAPSDPEDTFYLQLIRRGAAPTSQYFGLDIVNKNGTRLSRGYLATIDLQDSTVVCHAHVNEFLNLKDNRLHVKKEEND